MCTHTHTEKKHEQKVICKYLIIKFTPDMQQLPHNNRNPNWIMYQPKLPEEPQLATTRSKSQQKEHKQFLRMGPLSQQDLVLAGANL